MVRQALLAVLPLLAACAIASGADADPELEAPLTSWTFVAIDGQPPRSDKAVLHIYEKRIGATVGCNGLSGNLELTNGQLKTGPIVSTQMYCEGLMEQERAVAELLSSSPAFFVENGSMGIHYGKHMAELVRKAD